MSASLSKYLRLVDASPELRWKGKVHQVTGGLLESEGPPCCLGECCEARDSAGQVYPGEVVGFRGTSVLMMPLDKPRGIRFGDPVYALGVRPHVGVGEELLGRVIDAGGNPIDGGGRILSSQRHALDQSAPGAMERVPIREPLGCGIRAIDAFVTCGRGQRRRHLWRQRRRQKHSDRHDGARHLGRPDRTRTHRRARPRGQRFS